MSYSGAGRDFDYQRESETGMAIGIAVGGSADQAAFAIVRTRPSFALRSYYSYRPEVFFEAANTPYTRQGGYGVVTRTTY